MPLGADEAQAMFVGAPYFTVEEHEGKYRPQILFRGGDAQASERFMTDYETLGHPSFLACTLGVHRRGEAAGKPDARLHGTESAETKSELLEVPSMLSATGLDPGTVGFEHFLQLPISDIAVQADELAPLDKRKVLQSDPEELGLRELNTETLIARLTDLSELHAATKGETESPEVWNEGKIEEMGEDLFGKLLSAELGTTAAGTGSVTLKTQIHALQKVLNISGMWHDFSLVEWRIRVGQLLWTTENTAVDEEEEDQQKGPSERDILLLQITLAAELQIRIHAARALCKSFPPLITADDCDTLEALRPPKIDWDLLLAERFLENLSISTKISSSDSEKKNNRISKASLFSAITFFTARETEDEAEQALQPILVPKDQQRQLDGLIRFAEAIKWPHAQSVRIDLEAKLGGNADERPVSTVASVYATPLSSPGFPSSASFNADHQRPAMPRRTTTAQSMQLLPARGAVAAGWESFEVGGWLSRSWLSGLVMPGEAASHFLISTLLENSPEAITALGDAANLYGGFVYGGRSFWSKSCVVGRVLGASREAAECMGWMSILKASEEDLEDGWVSVEVKEHPDSAAKPRVKDTQSVGKASDPLHNDNATSLQAGDFTTPTDGPMVMGNEVKFDGLSFKETTPVPPLPSVEATSPSSDTDDATPTQPPSVATLTFSSPSNSKLSKVQVPLTYDIHFVSSYPCHPEPAKLRFSTKPKPPSPKLSFEVDDEEGDGKEEAKTMEREKGEEIENEEQKSDFSAASTPKLVEKSSSEATNAKDDDLTALPALPSREPSKAEAAAAATPSLGAITEDSSENKAASASATSLKISPLAIAGKELPALPAHPLHIAHHFAVVPVATLLSMPTESRPRALSSPTERKLDSATTSSPKVDKDVDEDIVVLDCRGAEDLEVLARAWCAKVGENAVVGRKGRTCLACCVREARAVGVAVVIRT